MKIFKRSITILAVSLGAASTLEWTSYSTTDIPFPMRYIAAQTTQNADQALKSTSSDKHFWHARPHGPLPMTPDEFHRRLPHHWTVKYVLRKG